MARLPDSIEIPARIDLHIREGVPNTLHEFNIEAKVDGTKELPNGKLRHTVDQYSIIEGLLGAVASAMNFWLEKVKEQDGEEGVDKVHAWLKGRLKTLFNDDVKW